MRFDADSGNIKEPGKGTSWYSTKVAATKKPTLTGLKNVVRLMEKPIEMIYGGQYEREKTEERFGQWIVKAWL